MGNAANMMLMKKKIAEKACDIGTIRHLVSIYINVLVEKLDFSSIRGVVFDGTFLSNVRVLLSGSTLRREKKKPVISARSTRKRRFQGAFGSLRAAVCEQDVLYSQRFTQQHNTTMFNSFNQHYSCAK